MLFANSALLQDQKNSNEWYVLNNSCESILPVGSVTSSELRLKMFIGHSVCRPYPIQNDNIDNIRTIPRLFTEEITINTVVIDEGIESAPSKSFIRISNFSDCLDCAITVTGRISFGLVIDYDSSVSSVCTFHMPESSKLFLSKILHLI